VGKKKQTKDAQQENAAALQEQIDEIVRGVPPKGPPRNLREAIDRKMAEDRKKQGGAAPTDDEDE
jgi:hypothetical protein